MADDLQLPSLSDMMSGIVGGATASMQTGMPAEVVSFAEGPPARCSVRPLIRRVDPETGEESSLPVIVDVPVVYPAGGGFRMSWPLAEGDQVWLAFGSRDIGGWKTAGAAAGGRSSRRASLSDAVAFAGFAPSSGAPAIELVVTEDGKLRLGSPAVDLVAKLQELVLLLSTTTAGPDPLSSASSLVTLAAELTTLVDS